MSAVGLPRIAHLTPADLDETLAQAPAEELLVLYFWGPDCPNCDVFAADLPALIRAAPGNVRLAKVNAYEHPELARRFALFGVPAFVLFRAGKKLGMMREYYGREAFLDVVTRQALGNKSLS